MVGKKQFFLKDDKQKAYKIGGNQFKQVRNHKKYKLVKFTYGEKNL